jgi:alpha-galactosidase
MDFGIWVEPEMVNPDSDLYRTHPDWAYHFEHRNADELRHQLVLNMTRGDVQNYIFECLDNLLENHNIKYIKWDMNRPFSQVGAENLENAKMYSYLHTMAVYKIVDELKKRHPQVQFESCASGGGRCDLGAISHYDQVWTSDNTDAIDRMTIQKGYSLLHPVKTMRAWVTDICGINKPCSLDFRFNIAMQGSLGIGGNLIKYSAEDLEICKKNIDFYKSVRNIVQFGDLYRILDIEDGEVLCNEYVSTDKNESVVFIAANATRFFKKRFNLHFAGLDENKTYSFSLNGDEYVKGGAYLMNVGVPIYVRGADYNRAIIIKAI